jgi:tetratricopeptide (TPR) repeat protein
LLLNGEPQSALEAMRQDDSAWGMIGLPMIYQDLGQEDDSDAALTALIDQYGEGWAYNIAYVYAYLGDADSAFEWLDKAIEIKDNGLSEALNEPLFKNLHDDPRWLPFLQKINYSPEQLAAIEFNVTLVE